MEKYVHVKLKYCLLYFITFIELIIFIINNLKLELKTEMKVINHSHTIRKKGIDGNLSIEHTIDTMLAQH